MRRYLLLFLMLVSLSGCGVTFEAGVEPPRGTEAPAAGQEVARAPEAADKLAPTIEALQSENRQLRAALEASGAPLTPQPPDLGQVAYVQGGDIWVKRLPAGPPVRLTSDGRNSQPRWSPSQRWLAFIRDRAVVLEVECDLLKPKNDQCRQSVWQRQLWLVELDTSGAVTGAARQLNDGLTVRDFEWSPQRDRLAYVDVEGTLHALDASGGATTLLVGGPDEGTAGAIAWSPDGEWIGFEYARSRPGTDTVERGIWKVAPEGGKPVPLYVVTETGQGKPRLAGWTPTARSVLFWRGPEGMVTAATASPLFEVAGSGEAGTDGPRLLAETPGLLNPGFIAPAPAGSGAGNRDAIAAVLGSEQATWHDKRIGLLNAADTPTPLTAAGVAAIAPNWSPDGTRVAYSAMPDREGLELGDAALPELMARHIWVSSADGGSPRQLTGDAGYRDEFPVWSADGRSVLFARLDAEGGASLWVVAAAGGAPQAVVDEITPAPDPLGAFGDIPWGQYFDWTRGSVAR